MSETQPSSIPKGALPRVWAIRNRGWIELRKGPSPPRPNVTKAVVSVQRYRPGGLIWSHPLASYIRETSKTLTEKITLQNTTYTGSVPFKWVPTVKFIRLAGQIKHGEVKPVPPFLAAVYLGLKPERKGKR